MILALFAALVVAGAPPALAATSSAHVASQSSMPVEGEALDVSDLEAARGGEAPTVTVSSQTLAGVSGGNTIEAGSVATGGVSIGSGAFSGFNGLGNFVVNTGNNNVVQGALSVSISMPSTH